ncbi:GNAT family N-acetyltransferase [Blautia producta]|uniref:GNAT family N-acetyltransferase n=1 Tax=Blautia producta TaxID=33035 RepID=UPI0031B5EED4
MNKNADDLRIRMAEPDDAFTLLGIYEPYVENTCITFEYQVPSLEEFTKRIRETLKKYPYLAAEQNGEIAGYAYASPFKGRPAYDWAVETTVYLKENAKGKGIGRQLYTALEDILRKQNITNANACITYPNPESMGFHKKMGYRIVGHFSKCGYKDGQWRDVVWMEKFLQEHLEKPEAVIPVGRLHGCLWSDVEM